MINKEIFIDVKDERGQVCNIHIEFDENKGFVFHEAGSINCYDADEGIIKDGIDYMKVRCSYN